MARILLASEGLTATNFCELLSEKHHVEVAAGGVRCLQSLRESLPDLLILDEDMPWGGADGVLAWLSERTLPLRTIIIPAIDTKPVPPSFPFAVILQKPVVGNNLLETVERLLGAATVLPTKHH